MQHNSHSDAKPGVKKDDSQSTTDDSRHGHVKRDLKNSPAAQFEYGRESQKKTEHFDASSQRLRKGNPDVGNVDLGTIEADRPAEPDDIPEPPGRS